MGLWLGLGGTVSPARAGATSASAAAQADGPSPLTRARWRALEAAAARILPAPQQDRLLEAVEDGRVSGWPEAVPSPVFVATLRAHTAMGFLSDPRDPRHGGNRDHLGGRWTAYPGPRHAAGGYGIDQIQGRAPIRSVWGEEL